MKPTLIKFAASTMAVGASLVGVTPVANSNGISEADSRESRAAAGYAEEAREALNEGRAERAVRYAERAVERLPRSAEYRHLLGRAYLADGRFASAETSFQDALTINPDLTRTAFNLALAQIAQGDTAEALEELRDLEGRMGASDLGLAFALAGDRARAIEMLRDAARANGGDSRARQNLALAYAMDGRWAEARITASQDVSLAVLDQRMRDWAQFAQPEHSWDQVSNLLGVEADAGDPGQPVRLALRPEPSNVMVAEAPTAEPVPEAVETVPEATVAFTAPVEDYSMDAEPAESAITEVDVPAPVETAFVETPVDPVPVVAEDVAEPAPVEPVVVATEPVEFIIEDESDVQYAAVDVPPPAPSEVAVPEPVPAPAPAAVAAPTPAPADELPAEVLAAEPRTRVGSGNYYVQLGAFAVDANVERAWARAVRRYSALSNYEPTRAIYNNGRQLHRLSFGGFESRAEAARMCRTLRRNRVSCFVRARAGDSPFRMAARAGAGLAAAR